MDVPAKDAADRTPMPGTHPASSSRTAVGVQ